MGCSAHTCANSGVARSERGNPDADHQQRRGGNHAGTLPAGGKRDTISQASWTMANWCPPRRSSRGSTIVRIINGVNVCGGATGEEDTAEVIVNRKSWRKQIFMVWTYMKLIKMIGHKKLCQRQTKRDPKNGCWVFFNSHKIQKVSQFLPKLGRMG